MVATYTWAENGQATVTAGGADAPSPGTVESWTLSSSTLPTVTTGTNICACADTTAGLQTETVWITNITGATATVVRGAEGTTPVTHAPPFTIQNVISVNSLLQQAKVDWTNAVTQFGADNTGGSDPTTVVNNVIGLGGVAYFPAGTYALDSIALAVSVANTVIKGDGEATIFQIGSSFSGSEVFNITAAGCRIEDIAIVGASATVTSNPACNGIEITGVTQTKVTDVFFQYVNGWAVESVGGASQANYDTMIDRPIIRNCAGGIHVKGVTGTSFQAEHFLSDVQIQQLGAASGTNANLDGLMVEDAQDVLVENINVGVTAGTGHAIHVKGNCSAVLVTNPDVGGGTDTVLVEDSSNGSASHIRFTNGGFQAPAAGNNLHVTGGAGQIVCTSIYFRASYASGVRAANTGTGPCELNGCRWNTSNQSNGTAYDLDLTSATTRWIVSGGAFATTVGSGAGKVTNPVNDPASVGYFFGTSFVGTGTTHANAFAAGPALASYCPGYSIPAAPFAISPANPTATAGTVLTMMGLGTACTYTPAGRGNVLVAMDGFAHTASSAVGVTVAPRYGSGTAPSNGGTVTGTRFGAAGDPQLQASGATREAGWAFTTVLPLTSGTAYWFDVATDTTAAGDVATITNVSFTAVEQP